MRGASFVRVAVWAWAAVAAAALQAQTSSLQFNVEYSCGPEHVIVSRCRSASDRVGFPATRPQDDWCTVYYPDRPKHNGYEAMASELRGDVVRKLQACGALGSNPASNNAMANRGASSAAAYVAQGLKYYEAKNYTSALQSCNAAAALKPDAKTLASAYYCIANSYQGLGQYQENVQALQNALRLEPGQAGTYFGLGWGYYNLKQYENALANFQESARLKPGDDQAHYWIGETLQVGLNQPAKALPAFLEALRLQPKNVRTNSELGYSYYTLKQFDKAVDTFQKAIRIQGDYVDAWAGLGYAYIELYDFDKAQAAFQEAVRLRPKDPRFQFELGYAYGWSVDLGQKELLPKAIAAFKEAIRLKPDYTEAYGWLGSMYAENGRKEEALQVYKSLLPLNKGEAQKLYDEIQNPVSAKRSGSASTNSTKTDTKAGSSAQTPPAPPTASDYLKQGDNFVNKSQDYAKAIEAYKKGLSLNPDSASAASGYNSLGVAYFRLKQYPEAAAAFEQSVHFKPDFVMAHFNLGVNYDEMKQYDKAARAYAEASRLKPDFVDAEYRMGVAYCKLQQYSEAAAAFHQAIHQNAMNFSQYPDTITAFEQAVRLKPNDAELQYDLGWAYWVFKQNDKAISALTEALRLKPDYADANSRLASVYFSMHQYAKAIPIYEQAIRLNPKSAGDYYSLGNSYVALGKSDEAMKVYERLKPIDKTWGDMLLKEITLITKADQGDPEAQNTLGFRYENGLGRFQQDHADALKWYKLSANQGWGAAQNNLCGYYTKPMDLLKNADGPFPLAKVNASRQDMTEAIHWCGEAAEQEFMESQTNLTLLYARGSADIRPDYEKAYFWINVTRRSSELRDKIGMQLTEGKRAEIENHARIWQPVKKEVAQQ